MYLNIILTLILLVLLSFPIIIFIIWMRVGRKFLKSVTELKDNLKQPKIEIPKVESSQQNQNIPQMPDLSQMMGMMNQLGSMFGNKK